jgi:signal transduction histidine kinase
VLVNLIGNASAYSPPGGEITVTVTAAPGCVEVRVRDQGPGVPRCERERIFSPYARGRHGRETRASGLGLGLHIVRTLVQLHGGTVGVRSVPGQGAAFWFRLPTTPSRPDERLGTASTAAN